MMMRYGLAILAYLVPTFALGFVWHLILFEDYYLALQIYRTDIIIPFGFLAMLIQSVAFAWLYDKGVAQQSGSRLLRSIRYAAVGGILSWSFTTITVAAKNVMASVPDYLLIETAFTLVQWIIVAPLTVFAFARRGSSQTKAAAA